LSLVTVWLWWMALSSSLKTQAKDQTYLALKSLPVVSAQELATKPDLLERPVAVQDQAYCAQATASGTPAIATKASYSGEDELEGDENDYISVVDYGSEQDVGKFTLGSPNSSVRVDSEAFNILPVAPSEHTTTTTNEYSSVKGGYLDEYQDRQAIPCGTQVVVTGVFVKNAGNLVLTPLPRSLSVLTDRPWSDILGEALGDVKHSAGFAVMWFIPALILGLVQLATGLSARFRRT
jgi:hypothetical protein